MAQPERVIPGAAVRVNAGNHFIRQARAALVFFLVLIGYMQPMSAIAAPVSATAQPAEPRLIGTWYLVSYELRNGDDAPIHPLGPHAQGQIIYDAAGNMSCHLLNPNPPARPTDAADGVAYEQRMSYDRYSSYYGPYEVDRASRAVHHHVVGSLMPGWAGTTVVRNYVFDGDDALTLSARTGVGDQQAILKWQRVK